MLGSGKTGTVLAGVDATAARSADAETYRRYAVGLYRQALFDRRGYIQPSRVHGIGPRDLAVLLRAVQRRLSGGPPGRGRAAAVPPDDRTK
jgi:hypothetical protein